MLTTEEKCHLSKWLEMDPKFRLKKIYYLFCESYHEGIINEAGEVLEQLNSQLRKLGGHTARVSSLAWNGTTLSSGGRDSQIINHDGILYLNLVLCSKCPWNDSHVDNNDFLR